VNRSERVEDSITFWGGVMVPLPQHLAVYQLGLTLSDLPVTVWNLIPGSFLADYFTNVSQILDGFRVLAVDFVYLGRSELRRNIATAKIGRVEQSLHPNDCTGETFFASGGDVTVECFAFARSPLDKTSLVPSFQFEIPGIKQGFNMAALAAQSRAATSYAVR
jgi:hypothetical protein